MISPGHLYDLADELKEAKVERLRTIATDLVDEAHRLRHLVEEMADFRHSAEHTKMMEALERLEQAVSKQ